MDFDDEQVVGGIGDKRRWREYKARVAALPADYREAIDAVERYLMYRGVITKGDTLVAMLEELADLFAQGAAVPTPESSTDGRTQPMNGRACNIATSVSSTSLMS